MAAEAEGYVLKKACKEKPVHAIRRLLDQGTYSAGTVMDVLLKGLQEAEAPKLNTPLITDVLTPRELEVLHLIVAELDYRRNYRAPVQSVPTRQPHTENTCSKEPGPAPF